LLDLIKPEIVHIFAQGRILKTGGFELAEKVEKEGYDWLMDEVSAKR
jgi:Fe-S cluster assembly ATP-binding protein